MPAASCIKRARSEPIDLYTVTPKSTFDPDLPAVYWQLAVEAPAAAANLNTGRIAIAMTPTSTDYYAKAAWTDRAPLMVQTRIVDSFENTPQDRRGGPRIDRLRANYVLQPDLRNFEALYYYGKPPIVRVRIIAKLVRLPDRQIIGVGVLRALRARARRQGAQGRRGLRPGAGQRDQAAGRVDVAHAAAASRRAIAALRHRALSQPRQCRDRQRELPEGQRHLDGAARPTSSRGRRPRSLKPFSPPSTRPRSAIALRAVAVLGGGLGRGVAVEAALVDALHDGGEAEQREGEVEVPGRDFLAAGAPGIGREILRLARECRTP